MRRARIQEFGGTGLGLEGSELGCKVWDVGSGIEALCISALGVVCNCSCGGCLVGRIPASKTSQQDSREGLVLTEGGDHEILALGFRV